MVKSPPWGPHGAQDLGTCPQQGQLQPPPIISHLDAAAGSLLGSLLQSAARLFPETHLIRTLPGGPLPKLPHAAAWHFEEAVEWGV